MHSTLLKNYLAASLGTAAATSFSSAAIVDIDVTALGLDGANAGVGTTQSDTFAFPWVGSATLTAFNQFNPGNGDVLVGLGGSGGLSFAVDAGSFAVPKKFGYGDTLDGNLTFSDADTRTVFDQAYNTSPAFEASRYMGFQYSEASDSYYGWLEVTWDPTTDTFEILDGAYENTPNTAILAGAQGVSAVPEPTGALSLLALIGGGSLLRRRKAAR